MPRKPREDFFLFLIGGSLFAAGIVLFTNQVIVSTGYSLGYGMRGGGYVSGYGSFLNGLFSFGNGPGFGLLMIPFGIGVALLLADALRKLGWLLVWGSCAAIGVLVLQSLLFNFRPTSLTSLLAMVVMVGGGGGLMFKSLRDYRGEEEERSRADLDDLRAELQRLTRKLDRDPGDLD